MFRGACAKPQGTFVGRSELDQVPVGPFEMEADDLFVLGEPIGGPHEQPFAEAFVKVSLESLQDRRVRRIAHEEMHELEVRIVGLRSVIASDQPDPLEGAQRRPHAHAEPLRGDRCNGRLREDLSDDRTTLQHSSIGLRESVQARGQERLDRWWYRKSAGACRELPAVRTPDQRAVLLPLREHLFEEEGIPLGS